MSDLFGYRVYRNDDARLDAQMEDIVLRGAGVIEDDEPTEYSHFAYMARFEREATGDFTPDERLAIRASLGIRPFSAQAALPLPESLVLGAAGKEETL